jgi:RNA polymerase sigma-70 factor, ECF subfamily
MSPTTAPPPARVSDELMTALYEAHHRVVVKFALRLTFGDRQLAEDATQEAFLRLWRHPEALDSDYASIRPWLLTVTRRVLMDMHRAKALRPNEVSDACLEFRPAETDDLEALTTAHEFSRALADLTPRQQSVLVEVYYHGCSMAEAAERLGIPVGTVKSRTHGALRALREALIKRGLAPEGAQPAAA